MFEVERKKDETHAEHARRRVRQLSAAARFGMVLPDEARGKILTEGERMTQQ